MRRILIGAALLGACTGGKDVVPAYPTTPMKNMVTAGSLESLPQLELTNGRLVCLAESGAPCQVTPATANWLHDGKYATWESRKPVLVWTPDKTDPEFLGDGGKGDQQYDVVLSVA